MDKYLEISNQFNGRVSEIRIALKVSNRVCEMLAKHIQKEKPKNQLEQDRIDKLTDYVIKTSELNDKVLGLIEYTSELLSAVAVDSVALTDATNLLSTIEFQSETIQAVTIQRDNAIKDIYDLRKNQINTK